MSCTAGHTTDRRLRAQHSTHDTANVSGGSGSAQRSVAAAPPPSVRDLRRGMWRGTGAVSAIRQSGERGRIEGAHPVPQKHRRTHRCAHKRVYFCFKPRDRPLPMQPRPRGFVGLSLLPPFGDCGLVRGKAQWGQEGCCDAPLSPPYFILFIFSLKRVSY